MLIFQGVLQKKHLGVVSSLFFFAGEVEPDRLGREFCCHKRGGFCRSNVDKEAEGGGEGPLGNAFSIR